MRLPYRPARPTRTHRRASTRRMQLEQLEKREVLAASISLPATVELSPQFSPTSQEALQGLMEQQLLRAFQRASDLSRYTPEQIASAKGWVLHITDAAKLGELEAAVGAANLEPSNLIANTFIYTLPQGTSTENIGKRMNGLPGVDFAYPLVIKDRDPRFIPNDPLYTQQWHLNNTGQTGGLAGEDPNLEEAWDISRGTGVVIGIVDGGTDYTHPDLAPNYLPNLSIDVEEGDNDPSPAATGFDFHGTAVAGVAAAATDNGLGVAGAAPDARFAAIRLLGLNQTDNTEAQALSHMQDQIHIYNNSWGPKDVNPFEGEPFTAPDPLMLAAMQTAVIQGRGGLGNLLVWAGGNGGEFGDNSNYDGYANSLWTLAIGAIDHRGVRAPYSEPGANLIGVTYARGEDTSTPGILTTDIPGADGYNGPGDSDPFADLDYTSDFGGTSAAAPLASGIIALMLGANPNLSVRDVQHILIESARQNDPSHPDWTTNGAGYHINHNYGFGAFDALAAVELAANWTPVDTGIIYLGQEIPVNVPIPDSAANPLTLTIDINDNARIEQIEIVLDSTHTWPADLEIILTSPDGTDSILAEPFQAPLFEGPGSLSGGFGFTTMRHWGELARGTWTLTIRDVVPGDSGVLTDITVNMIGTDAPPGSGNGRLEGTVWNDANNNGIFDANETGLSGVTVFLDANGNGIFDATETSRVTGSTGRYAFPALGAGTYTVGVVVPTGGTQTFPTGTGTHVVTLAGTQTVNNLNFGIVAPPVTDEPFTLSNAPGEGTVTVGVDGFGSFGSAVGTNSTNAVYNPVGPTLPAGTAFESGVAIGFGGSRTFLTSGTIGFSGGLQNPGVSGSPTSGTSTFVYNGLTFTLVQTLTPLTDFSGNVIGTQLTQTYSITNTSGGPLSFDLVRYFDGDLQYDGSIVDGGGRINVNGTEILFETDSATGSAEEATFIGITAEGGSIPAGRYEIDVYDDLQSRIITGAPLDNITTGDGADADEFIDADNGYDVTLALANAFTLAPGETTVYVTSTLFGTGIPAEILSPPPPPATIGGVVTNDANANGQYDEGEEGIPNVIVYLDINNDGKLGLGEPAQVTDSKGRYAFQVADGVTYTLRQAEIAGWQPTSPTEGGYTVTGVTGEVIDDLFFGNIAVTDFGTAGDPYGEASHGVMSDFYLGDGIGDDGVSFSSLIPGQTATVTVDVHNGSRGAGLLHAWVDFNGDGDWNDSGEQVLVNRNVVDGVNTFSFNVPSWAVPGITWARVRYGYGVNVGPTGHSLVGEVEDHQVGVFGQQPLAKSDKYTMPMGSGFQKLSLLANDVQSSKGAITLVGTSAPSLGGSLVVNPDNTVTYRPQPGKYGVETFTYTISDGHGGTATGQVTIDVVAPPVAIDNSYRLTSATVLDVLANDVLGSSTIAGISVPQTTPAGGRLTVQPGNKVRYVPPAGFTGIDQFEYTVVDEKGYTSRATTTVHVGNDTADDLAKIELVITDADGVPVTEIPVGAEFQLRVYVRDGGAGTELSAAYLDVLYSQGLVEAKPALNAFGYSVRGGNQFSLSSLPVPSQPGLLNEIGGIRTTSSTGAPELMMAVSFVATAEGVASFLGDPADQAAAGIPLDRLTFGAASVKVVPAGTLLFKNQQNVHDVSGDGLVTPLDALLIINELNAKGSHSLEGKFRNSASPHFYDVSGDNELTPLDALLVINRLNRSAAGEPEPLAGEALDVPSLEDESAAATADASFAGLSAAEAAAYYFYNRDAVFAAGIDPLDGDDEESQLLDLLASDAG